MDRAFTGETRRFGQGARPLRFAFWNVHLEIVFDNLARFAEAGEAVEGTCVEGDYAAHVTTARPEVFYAQRAEAALWAHEGRIARLAGTEAEIAPILAGMDARLVEGARDAEGRLLGLTYYNGGPFALFVHADHRTRLGGPPSDMAGILDAARRLRQAGMPHPMLPRWHATQTGLVWSLLCHLAMEGVLDLTDLRAPAALARVLHAMDALVREGLVPPGALDDRGDGAALDRWVSGQHALWFTMDYLAADAVRLAGRPISHAVAGLAGVPLMPGHALLSIAPGLDPDRAAAARRLVAWLGGPTVHRRWSAEALFPVPLSGPADETAMAAHFPPGDGSVRALIEARAAAQTSPVTQAPGALAWSEEADRMVRGDLDAGTLDPDRAASALLAEWRRLSNG
jgi:multiple sugar transport system substrate-binding protein